MSDNIVIDKKRGNAKTAWGNVVLKATFPIKEPADVKRISNFIGQRMDEIEEAISGQKLMFPTPGDAEKPKAAPVPKGQKKLPLGKK